jgi:hypothetical protein
LKKEILSDDFKKRKIFWKNIAENFLENFPYGKIFYGKFSVRENFLWKIFHLTSLSSTQAWMPTYVSILRIPQMI